MCGKANNQTVIMCGNMESLIMSGVFERCEILHAVSGKFIKHGVIYRDHPQSKAVPLTHCPFNGTKL